MIHHDSTGCAHDEQGIGQSTDTSGIANYTVLDYTDSTRGLIEALGLGSPDVVGWGLGGAVTLTTALLHPGIFRKLVLVGTGPGGAGEQIDNTPEARVS